MKHLAIIVAISALLVGSISCEKQRDVEPEEVPVVEEPKDDPNDDPTGNPYKVLNLTSKSAEFARLGSNFAFDFIDRINAEEKGDFFVSPLSMQFLLGMILDGTRGKTADEICHVLGYGKGEVAAVNSYSLSMLEQLPSLDKTTKLSIANALFVNISHPVLDSYRDTVGKYYLAEVSNLNFSDIGATLEAINGWSRKKTEGLIPKILNEVDNNAAAYLLNALYFKGQWKEKFSKDKTGEETFTAEDGTEKQVPMMKIWEEYSYLDKKDFQVVRLPYGNGAFNMLVVLPGNGKTIADVTAILKNTDWVEMNQSMEPFTVDLWLPKFEVSYKTELENTLSAMGMPSAFKTGAADYSAMFPEPVYLSGVMQTAIVKVDEEGTEAAAVSGAFINTLAPALSITFPVVFHADRPFLYLITESSTGAVLFAGKYSGK